MKTVYNPAARKRAVNLSLNEDLVSQARAVTENLSGVVESLLADYLAQAHQRRAADVRLAKVTAAKWNHFNEQVGSFADEHSTL